MNFSARITRCPTPFDPALGAEHAAQFGDFDAPLRNLIAGAAGCSGYLAGLLRRESVWLPQALEDPQGALEGELKTVAALDLAVLPSGLRQAKRRLALLTGLADLGGVWTLEEVTTALSRFADAAVDVSLKRLVAAQIARGKLPGLTEADVDTAGGIVSLAMGKGGAFELNYSSDIDLICLFDDSRFDPADVLEARSVFVRVTRKMASLLSDITADGYVFRTDLRLRPDPSVTPVCLSMDAAERYYESVGRTWERAAFIKARASAGDIAAGEQFLKTLTPFVWRKHLDFVAIQDAHDMRLRIREHKGLGGPITLPGHNMKLGRGGIREIEFFTQTRQLIAGGRDTGLRARGTVEGLAALARAGWVPPEEARILTDHYRAHREVEHRLQMIADAQTHDLPKTDEGFDRLAAFMGTEAATLRQDLTDRLEAVHSLTEGFFAPTSAEAIPSKTPQPKGGRAERGDVIPPDFGAAIIDRWPQYPALRSERAVEIFDRLRPQLITALHGAAKPEEALRAFDGFLSRLPAGVQIFSLFEANPQLTQLIVDIAATAPALAEYLGRNGAVFDAVIGGDFFAPWPEESGLRAALETVLRAKEDYETKLDAARRWMKEWHFRIGVHHLRGLIDAEVAGRQYADLAGACLAAIYPVVVDHFAVKHGAPPGRGAVVLGMGSLGAGRLHSASDLDVIVIYDGQEEETSTGKRPLPTRTYFSRLTQALVTALSAPMSEGRLYEIDLRLRPSGRQGPVATAFAGFEAYQMSEAWTWEHLALTRARVVAGAPDLAADVERVRADVIAAKSTGASVRADVADMRRRIAQTKTPSGILDAKIGAGRLQDIELIGQTLALLCADTTRATPEQIANSPLDPEQRAALTKAAGLFWTLQCATKLLEGEGGTSGKGVVAEELGAGARHFILRETDMPDLDALSDLIENVAADSVAAIAEILRSEKGGRQDGAD